MDSATIRRRFLDFFVSNGHTRVDSAPLVPHNDNSLLFTNSGMVQFKDVFAGKEIRNYTRAVTAQRCLRAGGKHNDLDNVGYTARHHTFFEMLGNFSFGDYFKREAIDFAWRFLTETLQLPPDKLWVSVYRDDDEAAAIWTDVIGFPAARISRCDADSNFWQMGDTGPCGPCSEIFYDHGAHIAGGPPGSADEDGDRYIEIWNLVFTQFDRQADGTLVAIPKPCVDTGMGLERLSAVMQGVQNNFDTDLFRPIIAAICRDAPTTPAATHASVRVIADHIRSCAFLIADGVSPGNEGRDYVLRRILRRALRHGHALGFDRPFFHRLVTPLREAMAGAYPTLDTQRERIVQVIADEEERFLRVLQHGMKLLERAMADGGVISGKTVFTLYDEHGFPADLTADVAREHGLRVDMDGFDVLMAEQRARARAAQQFTMDTLTLAIDDGWQTAFTGYETMRGAATIVGLFVDHQPVSNASAGQQAIIVLDQTPFYAESGGQVGDSGVLRNNDSAVFAVRDTQKYGNVIIHIGEVLEGAFTRNSTVTAIVDIQRRRHIMRHHSAAHLFHAALRGILGDKAQQRGSHIDAERMRFDFALERAVTADEIDAIDALVNEHILANTPVTTTLMTMDEAKAAGALMLFNERYGDTVRVLTMGASDNNRPFSLELCGGTHVSRTGDIGLFKITHESAVAAGIRRIEAVCGAQTLARVRERDILLNDAARMVGGDATQLPARLHALLADRKAADKTIDTIEQRLVASLGEQLVAGAVSVDGIHVIAHIVRDISAKAMRALLDTTRDKAAPSIVLLALVTGDTAQLICGVGGKARDRVSAATLLAAITTSTGGKSGGRDDLARGGCPAGDVLTTMVADFHALVRQHLH